MNIKKTDEQQVAIQMAEAQSALRSRIWSLVGNASDAEDILQDTNLALLQHAADYDAGRPFLPWALSFARVQVMSWRSRRGRDRLVFDDELFTLLSETVPAPAASSPSDERVALAWCLRQRSREDAELLNAKYVDGLGTRELAARLGTTLAALNSKLERLRAALADCVIRKACEFRLGGRK